MPQAKTIKKELSNEKLPLIDMMVKNLEEGKHDTAWDATGEVLAAKIDGGGTIIITFPKEFNGKFTVEMDKKGEKLYKELEFIISQDITAADISKSIFKSLTPGSIKSGNVFLLGKNNKVFKELEQWFKKLKIEEVSYSNKLTSSYDNAVFDKLTLIINPQDESGRDWNYNYGEIIKPYKDLEGYKEANYNGCFPNTLPGEEIIPIKLGDEEIAKYYKERNMILLNVNPLANYDLKEATCLFANDYLTKIMSDLSNAISATKCKTVDNTTFKLKQMVRAFSAGAKNKLSDLIRNLSDTRRNIVDYEKSLTKMYTDCNSFSKDITALTVVDEDSIDNFLAEIKKVNEQPIITKVSTDNGMINITFKETTIKAHVGRTVESTSSNAGPILEYYIGEITCHLKGNGEMTVTSNYGSKEVHHPHVNKSAKPCLGSGDGPNMMHKLIGEQKFSDFIYVFWMWIKRYRPEDCHVTPYLLLDDRLSRGLPVFDQAGNRIEFGDEKLLKEGILNSDVKKAAEYDENMKKFKNFKPQK